MGRRGVRLLLALVIGVAAAGVYTGSSAAQGGCIVQLRVNVFGSSPPGPSWALQGGLNTGKTAILRAVERGCATLDHITGAWISGRTGPYGTHGCAGRICFWNVSSTLMSAAVFQAYARTAAGGMQHSNQVRVGWGGSGVAGDWAWSFSTTPGGPVSRDGCVTFTTNPNDVTWSGGSSGTWSRAGDEVAIDWRPGKSSVDTLMLSPDGRTMTGTNNVGDTVRGDRGC